MLMEFQKNEIKTLLELISEKQQIVAELQDEYEYVSSVPDSDVPIDVLNAEFLKLKAEVEMIKISKYEVIPKSSPYIYANAFQKILKDVKCLEALVSFQKDLKRISSEKESEYKRLFEKEEIALDDVSSDEETFENESLKVKILDCLHKKLVRRLKRIALQHYPVVNSKNFSSGSLEEQNLNLFLVLQKILIDIQSKVTDPNESEKLKSIFSDLNQENPQLLTKMK